MAIWRMSFRDKPGGPSFWRQCQRRGVATITYQPVADVDFSEHATDQTTPGWADLKPVQRESLRRFVRDMRSGDIIYVKEGPNIVGRGIVIGPYEFDAVGPIAVPGGLCAYRHQRRVCWCRGFRPLQIQLGKPAIVTLLQLNPADVERVEGRTENASA